MASIWCRSLIASLALLGSLSIAKADCQTSNGDTTLNCGTIGDAVQYAQTTWLGEALDTVQGYFTQIYPVYLASQALNPGTVFGGGGARIAEQYGTSGNNNDLAFLNLSNGFSFKAGTGPVNLPGNAVSKGSSAFVVGANGNPLNTAFFKLILTAVSLVESAGQTLATYTYSLTYELRVIDGNGNFEHYEYSTETVGSGQLRIAGVPGPLAGAGLVPLLGGLALVFGFYRRRA